MTPVQLPEVPEPYALDWPDEGLTKEAHAMRMWHEHMYDTGAEPLCTYAQLRAYATEAVMAEREAFRELIEAVYAEFCGPGAESMEPDDSKVSYPEDRCHITFGMIRRARARLTPSETNSER